MTYGPIGGRLELAKRQIDLGQLPGAVESLRAVLATDPDHAGAHALLALVLLDMRRLHAAEHEAGLAQTLEPEGLLPLYASAAVAMARRRFAKAEELYRMLLELDPESPGPYRSLAGVYGLTGRDSEVGGLLEKALEVDPEDPETLEALGDWHLDAGRVDEAERWARRALEVQPEHSGGLVLMGRVLLHRDQLDDAREHAVWALQKNPSDPSALHLLTSIKARRSLVLGLWWRYSTWMGGLGDGRAILVLLGAFVLYRIGVITAEHQGSENLASYIQVLWLGLVAYTWIGPGLFSRSLQKELSTVTLNKGF
ncbi:MAG: tetratricopeptide repeat protein [Acidobacteriota bacterium]